MSVHVKDQILIVDDKINNIYALEQILNHPDRNLISVTNGNEALKIALNQPIDLIILDVQMPGMDGFEVAQILKSNKRTSATPIIFVTAELKDPKYAKKGYEEGAVDYLLKPLNPEITEAKVSVLLQLQRQRKELQEKNIALEKYALLINNSADLICIINVHTLRFEEVNRSVNESLGYAEEELRGSLFVDYLLEDDRPAVTQLRNDQREYFSFEARMFTKNKELRWYSWNIVHKYGFWFANGRDMTRQRKADEEIRQLNIELQNKVAQLELTNKELESFSYSVSHDLRAPLRSINGYAQIIQDDFGPQFGEEGQRLFGIIQTNAKKMGKLIDDLLAFARMGRKDVLHLTVDMNKLVAPIVADIVQTSRSQAQINIQPLLPAHADPVLLSQVYINLISNAVKYSSKKEKSQIEIGSYEKDNLNVYFVQDNGAGFDMNYVQKLFGVFQRLHTNEEFEGTGVGLAIVQRIIVKHGGRVWAEGKPGEGATFFFSLPKPPVKPYEHIFNPQPK
jgi:PAS domain S-box-containing protein